VKKRTIITKEILWDARSKKHAVTYSAEMRDKKDSFTEENIEIADNMNTQPMLNPAAQKRSMGFNRYAIYTNKKSIWFVASDVVAVYPYYVNVDPTGEEKVKRMTSACTRVISRIKQQQLYKMIAGVEYEPANAFHVINTLILLWLLIR